MSNDLFDPAAFLDAVMDQPLERRDPLPVGDYTAVIGEIKASRWTSDKPDAKVKSGIRFEIPLTIDIPPEVVEKLGYDSATFTVKDSVMVDTTDSGAMDFSKGKNNQLRAYREALDMNKSGDVFIPRNMQGRVVLVKLKHELYNGATLEKVAGVARQG
jgi:hypothetical protein